MLTAREYFTKRLGVLRRRIADYQARRPAQARPCAQAGCFNPAEQGSDFCPTHEPRMSKDDKENKP